MYVISEQGASRAVLIRCSDKCASALENCKELYKCELSFTVERSDVQTHEHRCDVGGRDAKENSASRSKSYLGFTKKQ